MKTAFWRFAFKIYARRKPSKGVELLMLWGVGAIAFLYIITVILNPTFANGLRLVVALIVVSVGFAHRRVRVEWSKGPQALYAKAYAVSR